MGFGHSIPLVLPTQRKPPGAWNEHRLLDHPNEETPNPTQATGETNSGAHGKNRRIPLVISSTDWRVRIGEEPGFPEKPILAPFPLPDGFYGGKGK